MNRVYGSISKRLLCAVSAVVVAVATACAQHNPQLISDRFYPMYVRAYNLRKSPKCLPIADSLRSVSVAAGDRWGEVYALSIPFLYEFYRHDNLSGVERAMKPFAEKAKAYGFTSLYYYALSMKVAYYTREHRYIEAFMYLNEQQQLAEKSGHMDGVVTFSRMMGVILHFRGELSQAIGAYGQTIEQYRQNHYPRYISREYLSIADCYRMMGDYKRLVDAAEEALPYCIIPSDRNNVYIYECYGYFMLGRYVEFLDRYNYLEKHKTKLDNSYVIMNKAIRACKAIYDQRDADAVDLIEQIAAVSPEESYRLYVAFYKLKGDYMRSIDYMQKIINARYERNEQTFDFDRRSMNRIFRDQHLEAERQRITSANTRLKLSNAQKTLHNSSLELGRRRDAARLAEARAARSILQYNNQQLVARQLRDSIAAQEIVDKARGRQQRMENFFLFSALAMAAAAMLMTLLYIWRRHKLALRLRIANARLGECIGSLNIAKDKAQESARMKTLFIQNMSHEIRTPLNAIVGFSRLITARDNGLSPEESRTMARYISDNSDLLATLVNDILDITNLESGNFSMDMRPMPVNETCRETLATVRHRLAEGVALDFTTDADDSLAVVSDRHRVRQVLINMLTNAEKNTAHGSIVLEVSLRQHPCMVTFSVADTGVGVPKERQKEIFMRFHKLDDHKQGTGLGLDICRSIASHLGGEIDIDPEYTGGARFWFTIPITQ